MSDAGPRGPAAVWRSPGRRGLLRALGWALGLLLLAAAVAVVWRQGPVVANAWAALGSASAGTLLALFGAVVANLLLTGLMFSLLMGRFGRVGVVEMQALIAATAMINYLPLRPGLLGRLGYHRAVNGIPLAHSARVVVEALVISAAVAVWLAAALWGCGRLGWSLPVAVAVPVPVLAAGGVWRPARPWLWAAALRYVDVLAWALRYHAAFQLLGTPLEIRSALALACVSIVATMVPFVSNGLGLREWAVGLAAPLLSAYQLEQGLSAELVNRGAEVAVIVAAGSLGAAWLWRRRTSREPPRTAHSS